MEGKAQTVVLDKSFRNGAAWPDSVRDLWLRFTLDHTTNRDSPVMLHLDRPVPIFYLYRQNQQGRLLPEGRSGYELPYFLRSWRGNANDIPFVIHAADSPVYYLRFSRTRMN